MSAWFRKLNIFLCAESNDILSGVSVAENELLISSQCVHSHAASITPSGSLLLETMCVRETLMEIKKINRAVGHSLCPTWENFQQFPGVSLSA